MLPHDWFLELEKLTRRLKTAEGHFLQDDPVMTDGEELKLFGMLDILAAPAHQELIVVSPYFIPVSGMLKGMSELNAEGVQLKVLTTSLASNNHTSAHSHYKKYRRRILDTGAGLYEVRHDPSPELAKELTIKFEALMLPENAWRVHLDEE